MQIPSVPTCGLICHYPQALKSLKPKPLRPLEPLGSLIPFFPSFLPFLSFLFALSPAPPFPTLPTCQGHCHTGLRASRRPLRQPSHRGTGPKSLGFHGFGQFEGLGLLLFLTHVPQRVPPGAPQALNVFAGASFCRGLWDPLSCMAPQNK